MSVIMFHNFDINQMVLMIVALVFAVTIHEAAHGYVAYKMGDNTAMMAGRLTLNPIKHFDFIGSLFLPLILFLTGSPIIFGYAKPVPVNFANLYNFRKGTILVAAAGVAANMSIAVLSGIFFQILIYFKPLWVVSIFKPVFLDFYILLRFSIIINSLLAIFNLIPIPPLDGSRIMAMFLPADLRYQYMRIEPFGMIIIIVLLMTNSLNMLISFFFVPLVSILLG